MLHRRLHKGDVIAKELEAGFHDDEAAIEVSSVYCLVVSFNFHNVGRKIIPFRYQVPLFGWWEMVVLI